MPLHELHPLVSSELAKVPQKAGVYVLFQLENPLAVGRASNLQQALRAAQAEYPGAMYFAVEVLVASKITARLRQLEQELGTVRKRTFVGSAR
jgi:hypothetical protein